MSNSVSVSPSIGFFGLLTIALTVLKLTGHITLAWKWIALCFFFPLVIIVGVVGIILIFGSGAFVVASLLDRVRG